MNKRITWQNVDAPDFRDAALMQSNAAQMLSRAASTIGGTLTGINDRNIRDENLAAIGKGMQIDNVGDWDRMMAKSGIQGLGIGKGRANEALLEFAQGRRGALEGNRQTDFDFGQSQTKAVRDSARFANEQTGWGRDEYRFGIEKYDDARDQAQDVRDDQALADKEAELVLTEKAMAEADQISQSSSNMEEARRFVLNKYKNDPAQARRVLAQLEGQPDGRYSPLSDTRVGDESGELLQSGRGLADTAEFQTQEDIASSPGMALVVQAQSKYGDGSDGMKKLLTRLSEYQAAGEGTDGGKVDLGIGEVENAYGKLKKQFPNVPDNLIYAAMEEGLTDTGVGWIANGDLTTDLGKAADMLRLVEDDGLRAGLFEKSRSITQRNETVQRFRKDFDRAEEELRLALDRENPEQIREKQQALRDLQQRAVDAFASTAPTINPDADPAAAEQASLNNLRRSTAGWGGGDRAPSPNLNRAEGINQGPVGETVRGIGSTLLDGATAVDRTLGRGAGAIADANAWMLDQYGSGLSALNPRWGARAFDAADDLNTFADVGRQDGFVGLGAIPRETPAPAETPAPSALPVRPQQNGGQEIMAAAAEAPAETLQTIGEEAGLSPTDIQTVNNAIREIQNGTRGREQLSKVMQVLGKARQNAEASGNQQLVQMIRALEQDPGRWLATR